MRLAHLATVVTLLGACTPRYPGLKTAPAKNPPGDAETAAAVEAALEYVKATNPLAANAAYPATLSITWVTLPMTYKGEPIWGITYDGCRILVALRPPIRWQETSLAHELIHCLRDVVTGDADAKHEDMTWWSLLPGMQQAMRAATD